MEIGTPHTVATSAPVAELDRLGDEIAELSAHALRARNEASGLRLHARTACPGWQGERLDVVWAIDVLPPRAVRPRAIGD
jgi:hypothetical protein